MTIVSEAMAGQQEAEAVVATDQEAAGRTPAAGDALYAVSNKWFTQWCQYSGFTLDPSRNNKKPRVVALAAPGPRPGPIDNSDLVAPPPSSSDLTAEQQAGVVHLRSPLLDKKDLWLFTEPTWNLFKEWYGCMGPEVRRQYHSAGRRLQTEINQQHFRVVAQGGEHDGQEAVVGAGILCMLSEVKAQACAALGITDPDQYVVHDYKGLKQGKELEGSSFKTLSGLRLADQQALLLLAKAAPQPVPATPTSPLGSPLRLSSPRFGGGPTSPMSPLSRSFDRAPGWADDVVSEMSGRAHGLAGLGNLGNTCFMNSSLQCLAHTPPLMRTFLSELFRKDINKDNPLSLGGKLALAFGALMHKLWQGGVGSVSPKLFKWQLAKFAPQFSGYAQQDSQELLAFLLDGLHEDLNRITDKPYVEDRDSDGRPDEEVAAEVWTNYRRRNDSVIVDAFQGLYRSVLTCPGCGYQSAKFDPLMYLSLPLPSSKMCALAFTAVHVDGSQPPLRYGVEVPRSATVGQLYGTLAHLVGLQAAGEGEAPEDRLLLTQFNLSSGDGAVYADLKARVSGIEDLKSRFSFSRTAGHLYVLYVYPSAAEGPRAPDRRPVIVYHKARSQWVIPAVPLFVPGGEELAAELTTAGEQGSYGDTVVQHAGIQAALQQLLRPFRRHPEQEDEEEARAAATPEANGPSSSGGGSPMDEAPPTAAPAAGAEAEQGEAMEVEEQQQQQQQQDAAALGPAAQQQQPPETPSGEAGNAPAGSGDAARLDDSMAETPAVAPVADGAFDLWAVQKVEAAKASAAAAAAAASQPAYVLKLAKRGYSSLSTYGVSLSDVLAEGADEPLLLLAEWQEAAQQRYEAAPLLQAEAHASAAALAERHRDGGKSVSLADCLETFLQPEQLDAEDSWYCKQCKAHVQADKKLDLWSLPDVLVIHLKRFSYSRYSRDKLDTLVDFPLAGLDMTPYLLARSGGGGGGGSGGGSGAPVYDLYAVSNHYGGMGGGHYTAYARVPGTSSGGGPGSPRAAAADAAADPADDLGHWYTFDDSHVGRMEASGVKTSAAYVLFYRRRGAESCAVDVPALLAERAAAAQEDVQQPAVAAAPPPPTAGAPAAVDTAMLDSQEALESASQQAAGGYGPLEPLAPPPPAPSTSGGSSALGKRQPETIEEEDDEGEEAAGDDMPAAGVIEID